jgi:hypothetical protein
MTLRLVIRFVRVLLFYFIAQAYVPLYCVLSDHVAIDSGGVPVATAEMTMLTSSFIPPLLHTLPILTHTHMSPATPLLSSAYRDRDNSIFRNSQRWFRIGIMSLCIVGMSNFKQVVIDF